MSTLRSLSRNWRRPFHPRSFFFLMESEKSATADFPTSTSLFYGRKVGPAIFLSRSVCMKYDTQLRNALQARFVPGARRRYAFCYTYTDSFVDEISSDYMMKLLNWWRKVNCIFWFYIFRELRVVFFVLLELFGLIRSCRDEDFIHIFDFFYY